MAAIPKPNQVLILVDSKDRFLGYDSRKVCHTGKGKHHRAIEIVIHNSKKEILLQKRKHPLFNKMWDLAGATHPLHIGKRNESYTEAAKRCAAEEWGVHGVKFKNMGGFNYFKKEGKNCENEFCAVLVGKYDGKLRPDPKAAYGFTWKPLPQIKADARKRPSSYVIWAVKSLPKIKL